MKIKAALLHEPGKDWVVEEIDLDDPKSGEVQVRLSATGLCHSDEHFRTSGGAGQLPLLGGHEGAGVISKVGPGVFGLAEGDHVVLAFIPACGVCPPCSRGLQNLCDEGAKLMTGTAISDGGHRASLHGQPVTPMCLLGSFAPYVTVHQASVVKVDDDIPLELAALLGCGVSTGWGSATAIGNVREGDTAVVVGVGGVGINAVQGAAAAGAEHVIAIDPVAFKRDTAMEFGATHVFASMADAIAPVTELTWGRMAATVILTVGHLTGDMIAPALALTGKGGQTVVVSLGDPAAMDAQVSMVDLTLMQKRLQGAIFGGSSPRTQIPHLVRQYRAGRLKLAELITNTYRLEDVNLGYRDMLDGKNIRGIIRFTDEDY